MLNLGLCIDPRDYDSLGIADKVMRSINPTKVPIASIFPNFGFYQNIDPKDQLGVLVSDNKLKAFGEKLIRGITWVISNDYIESNHKIEIYFFREQLAGPFLDPLKKFGRQYSLGPGLRILRAVAHEDPISGLYMIEIYSRLKMYGAVSPV